MTASTSRGATGRFSDVQLHAGTPVATTKDQRDRARREVAQRATDAGDCAELLDMLGLGPVGGEWT